MFIEAAEFKQFHPPVSSFTKKGFSAFSSQTAVTSQSNRGQSASCTMTVHLYHALPLALFFSKSPPCFYTSHTQTFTRQASYSCDFTSCLTSEKVRLKMFLTSPSAELIYSEVNLLYSHGKLPLVQHGQFSVHSWRGWRVNWTCCFSFLEDQNFQQTKEHVIDGKSQGGLPVQKVWPCRCTGGWEVNPLTHLDIEL